MKSFKTAHTFENMTNWSHDLNLWVKRFKVAHGVYPNILLASDRTFTKIDLIANTNSRHKIKGDSGNSPEEPVRMVGFQGADYNLRFCVDEELEVNLIKLILDRGPKGGGEPNDEEIQCVG